MRKLMALLFVLTIVPFAVAACGGDDDDETTAATTATETTETTGGGGGGGTISVEADPNGELAYVQSSLEAEAGPNTIEFTNDASIPHDVVIEDSGGSEIARTDQITGSSTTADVELDAGDYTFFCSVPGHREAGMEGPLTVK